MLAVVDVGQTDAVVAALAGAGCRAWVCGTVERTTADHADDLSSVSGTKGVDGGSARLVGTHPV